MLMTAAPCSIARAMPGDGVGAADLVRERDVERAHAGPDAEDPAVVLGRGGDGGGLGPVRALEREAAERRDVAAGELGVVDVGGRVDQREQRALRRDRRRHEAGIDDRGAPRGGRVERVGRRGLGDLGGAVGLGVEQEAASAQGAGELARAAARDDVGAGADRAPAVARGDRRGRPARLRRRRSRCPARRRRWPRPAGPSAAAAAAAWAGAAQASAAKTTRARRRIAPL